MSQLKELIQIDKRFQNSINIQLDLENEEKLNSYIPTRSSLSVLERYLTHVQKNQDKANILIGPYGKGKSHLLLVLLSILSARDQSKLNRLIQNIEKISPDVAKQILRVRKDHKPFLPVLVSGTAGDLPQAFLLGMAEALERCGLSDIAPESYYSEAVKMMDTWEAEYPETYRQLNHLLKQQKSGIHNAVQLRECLKMRGRTDQQAYDLFTRIYPKLTAGSSFNPIVQTETLTLYKGMNHLLGEKYGFGGIYIIFDEFSKYIEGHGRENFARDMKIIQDMCELAQSSGMNQIHLTMVAHKSIKEYGSSLPRDMVNAYTGVEGRIKEESFVLSAQNNYELIANVIQKKDERYLELLNAGAMQDMLQEIYEKIPAFHGIFNRDDYDHTIAQGCFPLLPLTAYSLLGISEKVAQNERSIFTFLSNEEKGSLVTFVEHHREGENWKVTVDAVYDYFRNLFRENTALTGIHAEWLKADYALSRVETPEEKKLIKCLAILRMLRRPEEMPVSDRTLRLAAGMEMPEYEEIKEKLLAQQIILYRSKLRTYAFKNNVGLDLDKEIREAAAKKQIEGNLSQYLEMVSEFEYVLPKQHNLEYTMTRFFHYTFLTVEQFLKLKDAKYLFQEKAADGKILALVRTGEETSTEKAEEAGAEKAEGDLGTSTDRVEYAVEAHIRKLADPRIVAILPSRCFEQQENLKKLLAVKSLLKDQEFLEQNKVLEQELKLYQEDLVFEINVELEQLYLPENQNCVVLDCQNTWAECSSDMEFNRYLSGICNQYYGQAPKINNELINRQSVSAQIKKARNKIVRQLLEEQDFSAYSKGTSPEATIFRAALLHTGVVQVLSAENDNQQMSLSNDLASDSIRIEEGCAAVLDLVDEFIRSSAGKKQNFARLYAILQGREYGARKGIIPLFLAKQLAQLTDMPVIYLDDKEVELNEEILSNINETPEDYYLYVEAYSARKEGYLRKLEELFFSEEQKKKIQSRNQRLTELAEAIRRWVNSLPQYTLTFRELPEGIAFQTTDTSFIEKIDRFRKIFKRMDLNPREVLFEKIPGALSEEGDMEQTTEVIDQVRNSLNHFLEQVERQAAEEVRKIFHAKKGESLSGCLRSWYTKQSDTVKNTVLQNQMSRVVNYLEHISTNDETEIIKELSKAVMDIYTDDWKDGSMKQFLEDTTKVKMQIEQIHQASGEADGQQKICFTDSDGQLVEKFYEAQEEDTTSYFLSNAIESALEEFGDTLEMNQKVSVLVQALERLMKE